MKCPRCKSEDCLLDKKFQITCKKCNEKEYWKIHQEKNPDKLGDFV